MAAPDRITRFLRRHHVMTLATAGVEGVWCCNVFYAYLPGANVFVFTSDAATRHAQAMAENSRVAGSVVLETWKVGKIRGVQLTGTVRKVGEEEKALRKAYLKRFPYAAAVDLELWALAPDVFKMTDNRLGFGKKLLWTRNEK